MHTFYLLVWASIALLATFSNLQPAMAEDAKVLRVGIIGCDTSHVPAFTEIINRGNSDVPGLKVVAAYPGGSDDIPSSIDRVPEFTKQLKAHGVQIVDSVDALLPQVDVVLLESQDGRIHLEQVRSVFAAKKPVFIDKPLAATLADCVEIFRLAEQQRVPCFSASSLRYAATVTELKNNPQFKIVLGCSVHAPCKLEPHHPDLFWYGVHGVETLFTIMGTGCETVSRTHTEGTDVVVGVWKDGRIGTFRGLRDGKLDYGMTVYGEHENIAVEIKHSYQPLVEKIAKFYVTHHPPVSAAETLEIFAFMEAADESKRQGGVPVKLGDVLSRAKSQAR
ncbi:MAG: Gfo/Idh/MocA family oxidoreductase [Pirellulales bacterium]|nr:Gfo/Idh/MocA family oxidoreductase [Pirellulales bacterium]